jgi:hypothetical protein
MSELKHLNPYQDKESDRPGLAERAKVKLEVMYSPSFTLLTIVQDEPTLIWMSVDVLALDSSQ